MQWWKSLMRGEKIESNIFFASPKCSYLTSACLSTFYACYALMMLLYVCVRAITCVWFCNVKGFRHWYKISHQTQAPHHITRNIFESWNIALILLGGLFLLLWARKRSFFSVYFDDYCWESECVRVRARTHARMRVGNRIKWYIRPGACANVFERDKNPPGKL